eukprot:Gb_17903 [translate_table: standard]
MSFSSKEAMMLFTFVLLLLSSSHLGVSELLSYVCNKNTVNANISQFINNFNLLLNDLVHNASRTGFNLTVEAFAPANKGFATGTITVDSLQKIYGLMQCWRDISSDNCTTCLTVASNSIDSFCSGFLGAQSLPGSCIARYETYPFFNSVGRIPSVESPTISGPSNSKNMTLASEDDPELLLSEDHMIFHLQALRVATGDFSRDNKLGEGGHEEILDGEEVPKAKGVGLSEDEEIQKYILQALESLFFVIPGRWVCIRDMALFILMCISFLNQNKVFSTTVDFQSHGNNPTNTASSSNPYAFDRAVRNLMANLTVEVSAPGRTAEGKEIAVKKLSLRSEQGKREFFNEVELVAKIQGI